MKRFFNALFLLLAQSTHDELVEQVQYLKIENEILRGKLPKQIRVTKEEKARLLRYGKQVGSAIRHLVNIVHPSTFYRWLRDERIEHGQDVIFRKRDKPRINSYLRFLIKRIANESGMGYSKIMGELKKLNLNHISRSSVRNIVKEEGIEPGTDRETGTWTQFIERHADTLWACDFMSIKSWTLTGAIDMYLLFFIHIESREVWVSPATYHPNNDWVKQQARNFKMHLQFKELDCSYLIRDRDAKFTKDFDELFKSDGTQVKKLPVRSPNLNAFAERFVRTLKYECLSRFMIFGQKHADYLVKEFVDYYHHERPHQGIGNQLIRPPTESPSEGPVACKKRLGGLIKHYYRKAA